MNRKLIFDRMENFFRQKGNSYKILIVEDQFHIFQCSENIQTGFLIRCQNFGETFLMNPKAFFVRNETLEKSFKSLLLEGIYKFYEDKVTIAPSTSKLSLKTPAFDYHIESEKDIYKYCDVISKLIVEVDEVFFKPMADVGNIAKYIAQFSYRNHTKVSVGGLFPVQVFKKIYFLFLGEQMERYEEYKGELYQQLESLPKRKPHKKEEAKIFLDNFNFLINKLEGNVSLK